jgi:hypothetical protein
VRDLPLTGAIGQFVDSTDTLGERTRTRSIINALYPRSG